VGELVGGLVGGRPGRRLRGVVARAGGNPLYALTGAGREPQPRLTAIADHCRGLLAGDPAVQTHVSHVLAKLAKQSRAGIAAAVFQHPQGTQAAQLAEPGAPARSVAGVTVPPQRG
jgi:hypothetical protein